MSKIHHSMHPL